MMRVIVLSNEQPKSNRAPNEVVHYRLSYLKEVKKPAQHPTEKLSLTFLSSFIQKQNQRHSPSKRQPPIFGEDPGQQPTPKLSEDYLNASLSNFIEQSTRVGKKTIEGFSSQRNNSSTQPKAARRHRKRANSDQKRFLNNLLADAVDEPGKPKPIRLSTKNGRKENNKPRRFNSFENEERISGNKSLFQKQFETFVQDYDHSKTSSARSSSTNAIVTKADHKKMKNIPYLYDLRFVEKDRNMRATHSKPELRPEEHIPKNLYDSVLGKMGFKEVRSFQWSKVSKNKRFTLHRAEQKMRVKPEPSN